MRGDFFRGHQPPSSSAAGVVVFRLGFIVIVPFTAIGQSSGRPSSFSTTSDLDR